MSFPYKLVAFDLDGTLAPSKGEVSKEISSLINKLSSLTLVSIISGGSFHQYEKQLLGNLESSKNIILLPGEGSERFEYRGGNWEMTGKISFPTDVKKAVIKVLREIISSGLYEIPADPYGDYIEDRDTEIAFSALGQDAPLDKKEVWDRDRSKRQKIKKAIEEKIKGVTVSIAGTTSIDILPGDFNKAKGLLALANQLGIANEEVVFIGDAIVPGGNDYSVSEAGIECIKVNSPEDTEKVIASWLADYQSSISSLSTPLPIFPKNPVVYFCAEYALSPDSYMYAGGLGILAGDYVLEAADQDTPFIAIGLKYGQSIPEGFSLLGLSVTVPIGMENVEAKVWHRSFSRNVHVLLLEGGALTAHLYDPDFYIRAKQLIVLGIGGVRLLAELKISPAIYHLNEGHTAFAGIALMSERKSDLGKIVASKHTILSAAGMRIRFSDLDAFIGPYCNRFGLTTKDVFMKGRLDLDMDAFSTTKFVMTIAVKKNSVSAIHAVFEKKKHPESSLVPITNGVYRKRWQAKEFLARPPVISDEELWKIKRKLRIELFDFIEKVANKRFNPDICTLVWARRFAPYKRPYLLFTDLERLTSILSNPDTPLQCVISGKPHEGDKEAEDIRDKIIEFSKNIEVKNKIVYLPDYSMISAEKLTRGADIWLNTPERGMEACGTSGMKAGLNGALECSVSDGWVDEVEWQGRGWILPEERTSTVLYDLLEHEMLPCFYPENSEEAPAEWVRRMRSTIDIIEQSYTSDRMLRDYAEKLYKL